LLLMMMMIYRLDVLLHVKWTVKEFEYALTRDIVELIDREVYPPIISFYNCHK